MNTVVLGLILGDEAKGRIVDFLANTQNFKWVVRFNGGGNAGHTLFDDDVNKTVTRLLPSGILNENTNLVLGQGMVIDLNVLHEELLSSNLFRKVDLLHLLSRIFISKNAHVVMPYHMEVEAMQESILNIGTTRKGIGPCMQDKVKRVGIRMGDLADRVSLVEKIQTALDLWEPLYKAQRWDMPSANNVWKSLESSIELIESRICDTSKLLNETSESILFEGAQAFGLDIDNGDYPYVTSSSSTIGGVLTGAGVSHKKIDKVVGIFKAYSTRVGNGPFSGEIKGPLAEKIREVGKEYGAVTKRPRRVGWLDLVQLHKACQINGVDELAIAKIDVLSGLSEIQLKVSENSYVKFAGWKENIEGVKDFNLLPEAAQKYIKYIENEVGASITMISTSPRRSDLIVRRPFSK